MEFKAYKKKILKVVLFILILPVFILSLSFYTYLKCSEPKLDGELQVKGMSSEVHIYRDQSGIPHLEASNNSDAFFALGYLIASERLFQMELSRRMAAGELSEIFGNKTLQSDKMFRNLKLKSSMVEMLNLKKLNGKIDPKMMAIADDFYRGINYFQDHNPLPIEFKILGIKPRPFTMIDGYSFVGLMSFSFGVAVSQEPLLTKLEKRLGADLVDEMRAEKINSKNKEVFSLKEKIFDHSKMPEVISFLERGFPLFEGSNGWIIASKRSSTNSPILANDPHISYTHPGIWFEAHIKTPTFESYGHFLPLIPFPILSHNNDKAWGFTMTLTDDMDLYQEKVEGNQYRFKGASIDLKKSHEKIVVKNEMNYEFDNLETKHGPLLNQILEDKNIALKWSFLDPSNDPFMPLYKMSMAKNIQDFEQAISEGISPGLNVLYADHENIAWWMYGKIDLKPAHVRSDFILDGASGNDEYTGAMRFSDKPHLVNPPSGIIVSANSRPANFPSNQRGDWQPDDRFNSISTILAQKEKWGIDETKELQTLSINLENKLILAELLKDLENHSENKKYIEMLKKWDFISDKNSAEVTIYQVFINKIGKKLLNDLNPEELETYGKISTSYIFLKRVLMNRESPWWKKFDRLKLINSAFDETISNLTSRFGQNSQNWNWGKIHTIEFNHPLGKLKPLNYIFNLGPYPIGGSTQDINNQKSNTFKDVFEVKAGPSTRRIINFSNIDDSYGILPTGESGHLLSPYYKNQVQDFINGKYRPMIISKDLILKNQSHHLILKPQ